MTDIIVPSADLLSSTKMEHIKLKNRPQTISKAQLHALLNRYEDQLQVCDNQRKTLEDAYTNGRPIKDLFAPVEPFRPVKALAPKKLDRSDVALLPAELRDVMMNLTVGDMSLVVTALKHRIDRIGTIIDNARLSCNDPTQTWDEVQTELAGVSKSVCDDGDGMCLSFADIVLGTSQDDMCNGLAAFNIASTPKETWKKAVPKDFGLYIGAPHAGRQSLADKSVQNENDVTGSLKRRDPTTVKKYGEYHGGFHPAELMKKGALTPSTQSPGVPPTCTLTTEIHPIFARERFIECPQEVYNVLKPSLQLATIILQHRATSRYWHTAAFGPRTTRPLSQSTKQAIHIPTEVPWTAPNATAFAARLQTLTNHCSIHFNLSSPDDANYGICIAAQKPNRFVLPLDKTHVRTALIHLSFDFYTTAVRLAKTRHPDPHMLLRFQFLFAVVLLHEMAHWIEFTHASTFLGEPYIGADTFNESGFAFEERTFGGRICAVNHRMDCAYGICMAVYDADAKGGMFYSVPMDYIIRVQQQSTWDDPALLLDPVKELRIPKDGARAFGPCTFSLLAWDDEEEVGGMMDVVDTGLVVGRKKDCGKAVHSNLLRVLSGRIEKAREREAVGPRKVDLRRKRFLSHLVEEVEEM